MIKKFALTTLFCSVNFCALGNVEYSNNDHSEFNSEYDSQRETDYEALDYTLNPSVPQVKVTSKVKYPWKNEYTNFYSQGIERLAPALLTKNVPNTTLDDIVGKNLCPNFARLNRDQKKQFWFLFMAALSFAETDFNPNDQLGNNSGLFQLSPDVRNHDYGADVKPHGAVCNFAKRGVSIKDPKANIECAIVILQHQVFGWPRARGMEHSPQRLLSPSRAYYWEPLYTKGHRHNVFLKAFFRDKGQLPYCG